MDQTTTVSASDVPGVPLAVTTKVAWQRLRLWGDVIGSTADGFAHKLSSVLSHLVCFGIVVAFGVIAGTAARQSGAPRPPTPGVDGVTMRRVATQAIGRHGAKAPAAAKTVETEPASPTVPPAAPAPPGATAKPEMPVIPDAALAPAIPTLWSETEIAAAAALCKTSLTAPTIHSEALAPMRLGGCGDAAPVKLSAAGEPTVTINPAVTINCRTAAAVDVWVKTVLQPAAREVLGSPVVGMSSTSSYVCRNRNGAATGPISEHAYANAFDVGTFKLADGRVIDVGVWGATVPKREAGHADAKSKAAALGTAKVAGPVVPALPASVVPDVRLTFLKRIHHEACGLFGTVLGPEANEAHREHLHLDMKVRKGRAFCE